ncbi:MAG: four helix bundle protein [Flavobacteriales bacterium]|nr:four helix bundle protein [Flavobacteriales bacterium]
MTNDELIKRTKDFALAIIRFIQQLPRNETSMILRRQLLRSATSVAANHRASRRARSSAEFYAKISIVIEEADESLFWLEIFRDSSIANPIALEPLIREADELVRIFASTRKTLAKHKNH